MRFRDRVDAKADRLQDLTESWRARRAELLEPLLEAKEAFETELLAAEDWAVAEGLIDSADWVDASGEAFLPWPRTEIITEEIPGLGTLFRERVEELAKDKDRAE